MSRARNRADGDFGDLDITNIGAVSLDSIKGDADANTSIAFSGSDVITFTTNGSAAATFNASQILTLNGNFIVPNGGQIGSVSDTDAMSIGSDGDVTLTQDLELQHDGATLSFGANDDVVLTHVHDTGLLLNSTMAIQFNDASQFINAPSATVLDINATDEIELNATLVDVNANLDVSGTYTGAGLMTTGGNIVIPDAGTIGSASDTNAIGISSGGVVSVTATTANTSASDGALTVAGGAGIAADLSVGDDLRLISDASVLSFGADSDVTLTHVADTGILLNSTMAIQFNDASQFINAPSATVLDINATDEIELNATLIDINGNVEISGTTTQTGISTSTAKDVFNAGMSVKNGSTSAGFVEFFEDSDNGTNKVTVIGPSSTSDVTLTLPSSAGTIATTATAADEATALAIALG